MNNLCQKSAAIIEDRKSIRAVWAQNFTSTTSKYFLGKGALARRFDCTRKSIVIGEGLDQGLFLEPRTR